MTVRHVCWPPWVLSAEHGRDRSFPRQQPDRVDSGRDHGQPLDVAGNAHSVDDTGKRLHGATSVSEKASGTMWKRWSRRNERVSVAPGAWQPSTGRCCAEVVVPQAPIGTPRHIRFGFRSAIAQIVDDPGDLVAGRARQVDEERACEGCVTRSYVKPLRGSSRTW